MSNITVRDADGNDIGKREVKQLSAAARSFGSMAGQNASVVMGAHAAAAEVLSRVMVAREMPRNMIDIENELLGYDDQPGICNDPLFAEKAIYLKPQGSILLEGLSVFFAEYISSIYCNLKVQSIEDGKNKDESQVRAVVWDMEKNFIREDTVIVWHRRNSGGSITEITDPDQVRLAVNRNKSFLERDVILSVIPANLKQRCFERLISTLDKAASTAVNNPSETLKAYADQFGVNVGQIVKLLNITKPDQLKAQHVRRLNVLRRAIKDELTTVKKVFSSVGVDLDQVENEQSEAEEKLIERKQEQKAKAKQTKTEQKQAETEQKPPAGEQGKPAEPAAPKAPISAVTSGSVTTASPEKSKPTSEPQQESKPEPAEPEEGKEPEIPESKLKAVKFDDNW